MDNSPLLWLCPDISDIIGKYLDTYQKNLKMKEELRYKIERSMLKCFNIRCKELNHRSAHHPSNQESLYKIPDIHKWRHGRDGAWQWVWKGKRMGQPTNGFIIRRRSHRSGVCCSCMKPCNINHCREGRKMELLIFPERLQELNDLGYFKTRLLVNELK